MMNYQIFYQKYKKVYDKISNKKDKYTFIVMSLTRELFIREVNLKLGKENDISKKDIRKIYKKCVFESKISGKNFCTPIL